MAKEIRLPTAGDLDRITELLRQVSGPNVNWGAIDSLNVWITEQRMAADDASSRRLLVATWFLVLATVGLVAATVVLAVTAR